MDNWIENIVIRLRNDTTVVYQDVKALHIEGGFLRIVLEEENDIELRVVSYPVHEIQWTEQMITPRMEVVRNDTEEE